MKAKNMTIKTITRPIKKSFVNVQFDYKRKGVR